MYIVMVVIFTLVLLVIINNSGICYSENIDENYLPKNNILEGANEFSRIMGNTKAIMFIHGFPGSPKMYYIVKELALKSGYDVFIPLLPGFGTNPKDLLKTNFSMWYSYVKNMFLEERCNYDKFYIVGNSMGGAITLKLAQDPDINTTGIASVAAPVFLNSLHKGVLKNPVLYFIRYLSWFVSYIPSKKIPKEKAMDEDGETEWVGYNGLFPRQIYSFYLALKEIKKDLVLINTPCFLAHAKKDRTISFKNLQYIINKINSKKINISVFDLKQYKHSNHSMFIYKSVVNNLWSDIDSFFSKL